MLSKHMAWQSCCLVHRNILVTSGDRCVISAPQLNIIHNSGPVSCSMIDDVMVMLLLDYMSMASDFYILNAVSHCCGGTHDVPSHELNSDLDLTLIELSSTDVNKCILKLIF